MRDEPFVAAGMRDGRRFERRVAGLQGADVRRKFRRGSGRIDFFSYGNRTSVRRAKLGIQIND